jgi:glycosyltransferase 2 family protein
MALGKTVVAALLLWLLLRPVDAARVWRMVTSAHPGWFAASFALMLLRLPLSGARWRLLLERRGHAFSTAQLTRAIFLSQFGATLLPAASGVDLIRGLYVFRRRVPAGDIVESLIGDRVAGVLSLILMSCPPALWAVMARPSLLPVAWTVFALAGAAIVFLALSPRLAIADEAPAPARIRRLAGAAGRAVPDRALLVQLVLLSVAFQIAGVVAVYFIGLAVGAGISVVYYVLLLPLIWLWMTLPITINGLGVRETAFVFYFGLVGMAPETAFTISTLVFAQTLLTGLLAGVLLALSRPGPRA